MLAKQRIPLGLVARRSSTVACGVAWLLVTFGAGCQAPGEMPLAESDSALTVSKFQGWQQVPGGDVASPPAVTMRAADSVDLFARGTDGNLYDNHGFLTFNGTGGNGGAGGIGGTGGTGSGGRGDAGSGTTGGVWNWNGYQSIGGGTIVLGASATTFRGGTSMAVAARRLIGGANVASIDTCQPTLGSSFCNFGDWTDIPNSNLDFDPAIVNFLISSRSFLYVIAADTNNAVRFIRNDVTNGYDSTHWETWGFIPRGVVNAKLAATVVDSTLFVVGRATGDHYYMSKTTDGATWSDWTPVTSQAFSSAPAVSSWSGGHLDVFGSVTTSPNVNPMFNTTSTDGGATWGPVQSVDGNLLGAPAAWSPFAGNIQTFGLATDTNPKHIYRNIYQQ